MRKEIKVTDKLINQFIKYLQEQEKVKALLFLISVNYSPYKCSLMILH